MKTIDIDVITGRMEELIALCHEKNTAAEAFSEAVSAVAEKSGASKAVIRKLVSARIKNTEEQDKADAESFATLIDEVA